MSTLKGNVERYLDSSFGVNLAKGSDFTEPIADLTLKLYGDIIKSPKMSLSSCCQ
jgi:hypothetical protein